jgi:hypothetical protein
MKATYNDFKAQENKGFSQLPPPGCYVAEIQGVKLEESYDKSRENIVCMIEITEGEFTGQYHKVFEEQKDRFSGVKYKGVFRLVPFLETDEAWVKQRFEGNLWCVEQSNPGYTWDWDENKLTGKKIGINVRKNIYTGNDGKQKETTEIAKFETVEDVKNGKCKPMKERVQQKNGAAATDSESGYTNVTNHVEVPF